MLDSENYILFHHNSTLYSTVYSLGRPELGDLCRGEYLDYVALPSSCLERHHHMIDSIGSNTSR